MKDDGNGQHSSSDPMVGHPVKLDAYLRKEGGKQQREHRGRHDPVKHPRDQRVPGNVFGNLRGDDGSSISSQTASVSRNTARKSHGR